MALRRRALARDGARARTGRERAAHYDAPARRRSRTPSTAPTCGDDGLIEGDTQTATCSRCTFDLLPEELRARAAERLVADIERHDGHLTTGFIGVGLLCPCSPRPATPTSRTGCCSTTRSLVGLLDPARRDDDLGALGRLDRGRAASRPPRMNSFNHYSLGSVGEWLYEHVAGIRAAAPGYGHVVIRPSPASSTWPSASYRPCAGRSRAPGGARATAFQLEVEIPANVTATVCCSPAPPPPRTRTACTPSAATATTGRSTRLGALPLQRRAHARPGHGLTG